MSELNIPNGHSLKHILEAALLAADQPLTVAQLATLFEDSERPDNTLISKALEELTEDCSDRGVELKEVASGYRLQVKSDLHEWVSRLWTERPQKYSRAMLETLSLIAYRQPITRGEIESVRGVSLSSNIIRSLQEREWIRIVGHRDVPGKPALFGTTKAFLDYFDLKTLDQLPTLSEIKDMETLEPELNLDPDAEGKEAAERSMNDAQLMSDAENAQDADAEREPGESESDQGIEIDETHHHSDAGNGDIDTDWDEDSDDLDEVFDEIDEAWKEELEDTVNFDQEDEPDEDLANQNGLFETDDVSGEEQIHEPETNDQSDPAQEAENDDDENDGTDGKKERDQ